MVRVCECVRVLYQGCPCQYPSPAPDMTHNSFSSVCSEAESSGQTKRRRINVIEHFNTRLCCFIITAFTVNEKGRISML